MKKILKSSCLSDKFIKQLCFYCKTIVTLLLFLLTLLSYSQNSDKIAPSFKFLIERSQKRTAITIIPELYQIEAVNGFNPKTGKYEAGYICLIYTKFPDLLKANGIAIQSVYPTYVTAWVTIDQIPEIASLHEVEFIDAPQILMPNNDICVASSGASLLHAGKINNTVYKGEGVIVAIIDTGIDWDHPDFRNSVDQTKSRILRIWDQTLTPISGEVSPFLFNYGVEYTQTQINDEIDGSPAGFVREKDIHGHGTHVAGTAAGNGVAIGKYTGLAPNADIVVVKAGNGSFSTTNIINALGYLQNLATTLAKPIVVNMSLGGQFGAHDGSTPQEVAVDIFSNSASGRVVVISAGNDNGHSIHKQTTLSASGSGTVSIVVPTTSATTSTGVFQFSSYANDTSAINATLTAPDGTTVTVNSDSIIDATIPYTLMGGSANVFFSNAIDLDSGVRKINVYVVRTSNTANIAGTWILSLTNTTTNSLTIDGWLNYKGPDFAGTSLTSGDSNYLINSPGSASTAITVASYTAKLDSTLSNGNTYLYSTLSQQDNISTFSSKGPRRDNVQKPDIAANGQSVVSCLSSDLTSADPYSVINGLYSVKQGTSMAAPEVTGCVSLLLQINNTATFSQIKTTLKNTATKDSFTTTSDNNTWGSGKIDVFKAASSQLYFNTLNRVTQSYDAAYMAANNLQINLGAQKATTRFSPTVSGLLGGLYFKTGKTVILTSLTVEVRTNNGGIPGDLLNSLTINPSSVSKYSWNYYDLSALNITVASGTDYFIVVVPGESSTLYLGQDPANVNRSSYYNGAAWTATNDLRIRSVVYTTANPLTFIWEGNSGTTDWDTADNWSSKIKPFSASDVIINGGVIQPLLATSTAIHSLTIHSGASLKVPEDLNLTVTNFIHNSGTLTIANNANLIQVDPVANTGNVIVKRNSSALLRLDYTLWSSPVANQNLVAFSPATIASRFYDYNSFFGLNGAYSVITNPSSTNFAVGKGYLIRMPNNANATTPTPYPGVFTGVLNNGDIPVTLNYFNSDQSYNLVGNPYPSVIDATTFINANSNEIGNTLYFWRKTNTANGSAYASYNLAGGVASSTSEVPNGKIQVGQGFFVQAKRAGINPAFFTNAMRELAPTSKQFFKTKQFFERNRVWVNLTNTMGVFSQVLIAYLPDASLDVDLYDGKYINDSPIALTSNINNEEYTIQGRPEFDPSDVVALNFKTDLAGDYTIALDHSDGVFELGHDVYLADAKTGTETNLKTDAYTFNAATGTDNSRFTLKYQKTLKVDAPSFNENTVTVYKSNGILHVKSTVNGIDAIKVFDLDGRLIAEQKNVNAQTATIKNLRANDQVLIVQVTSDEHKVVNKKVIQ